MSGYAWYSFAIWAATSLDRLHFVWSWKLPYGQHSVSGWFSFGMLFNKIYAEVSDLLVFIRCGP